MRSKRYEYHGMIEATLPMCICDLIPCILFTGFICLIGGIIESPLFTIGGIIVLAAGYSKILWKLIIVFFHKNLSFLSKQFFWLLPCGGYIMFHGMFTSTNVPYQSVIYYMNTVPNRYFLLAAGGCWLLLAFITIVFDPMNTRYVGVKQALNITSTAFLLMGALLVYYSFDYYRATDDALLALNGSDEVMVTEINDGYYFDGPGEDTAIIIYPGALVEYKAYAPLMLEFAKEGYDCFLCEMPMNLAIFGIKTADNIQQQYDYDNWYMAGHSLGGAMACSFIADRLDLYDGILLFASYSTESLSSESNPDFKVFSIYGSEDTVVSYDKLVAARSLMPENYYESVIPGGNHAGFGDYGFQKGDSKFQDDMTNKLQWKYTVEEFKKFEGSLSQ